MRTDGPHHEPRKRELAAVILVVVLGVLFELPGALIRRLRPGRPYAR